MNLMKLRRIHAQLQTDTVDITDKCRSHTINDHANIRMCS